MRAMARAGQRAGEPGRDEGGGRRLSALRHARARSADGPWRRTRSARRRLRRGGRRSRCWPVSISSRATASRSAMPRSRSVQLLASEPDKLAAGIAFGPAPADRRRRHCARPACCSPAAWCAGIIACGVRGDDAPDSAVDDLVKRRAEAFSPMPAGRSARAPMPRPSLAATSSASRSSSRLVGLTALLIGGVGVANAVKSHLERKRDVIATLKSLGATGAEVFALYLTQVMMLAVIGSAIGLVARRGAAVSHRLDLRRGHPAAARAGASCRPAGDGAGLRRAHRARLRAVAARDVPMTFRPPRCSATASRRSGTCRAGAMSWPPSPRSRVSPRSPCSLPTTSAWR